MDAVNILETVKLPALQHRNFRNDDFWKQSKPFVPKEKNENIIEESDIQELEIGDSKIPTPNEENKEEGLPF